MGKLRRLKKLRRALRGTQRGPGIAAQLRERAEWGERARSIEGNILESVKAEDARNFYVGMSISGPPEMFGLPPDLGCATHATGTPGCAACYPPRAPVTVTAVDEERGTITLSTAQAEVERYRGSDDYRNVR